MDKQIVFKPAYWSLDWVQEIREYFQKINDGLEHSRGPYDWPQNKLGWQGCWDRSLHHELPDNPVHELVDRLQKDFGDFTVYCSSIRYLSAPFMPHSDIRSLEWLSEMRAKNMKEGFIFLIPLWWHDGYHPGTAFYNSPARLDEPFYADMLDVLPNFADDHAHSMKNFSVRKVIRWQSPGDLIAWENFQWHSSCQFGGFDYNRANFVKEFISIETHRH